jgi:hypothetical protein
MLEIEIRLIASFKEAHMSDQTPNVSGSQGPNFIPPPQNTEAQYVKGQIPSPGDTIAPASTSYQCVSVPTGLSPLPTLNPSDDTLTIFQRQKKQLRILLVVLQPLLKVLKQFLQQRKQQHYRLF